MAHTHFPRITRSEADQWETPYIDVNTAVPALAATGQTLSHDYVVVANSGVITVTMDGVQVLHTTAAALPPTAYLYVTSSTGMFWERMVISKIKAVVTAAR